MSVLLLAAHLHLASILAAHHASVFMPVVPADAFTTLGTSITTILTELLTTLKGIAPIVAGMGLVMIGILYMGSSIPVIAGFKDSKPQAFSNMIVGIGIVFAASTIITIIPTT